MHRTPLYVTAGLLGAAGVALAAVGAHAKPGSGLDSAAHIALFHALAVIAGATLLERGGLQRTLLALACLGWLLGTLLFTGSVALRVLLDVRLFPMSAPTGGVTLIAAWLAFALAALLAKRP